MVDGASEGVAGFRIQKVFVSLDPKGFRIFFGSKGFRIFSRQNGQRRNKYNQQMLPSSSIKQPQASNVTSTNNSCHLAHASAFGIGRWPMAITI